MEKTYDHLLKLLLIGNSGVGKTCLFQRFTEDVFAGYLCATIGIDFTVRTIEIDGKKIKLQIWDTAGAERFKSLMSSYFRGAHGIILMYDVTERWSFDNTSDWIQMMEEDQPLTSNQHCEDICSCEDLLPGPHKDSAGIASFDPKECSV